MIRNCSAINSGWGLPWICFVTRGPMYTLARGGLHFRKKEKFAPGDSDMPIWPDSGRKLLGWHTLV